MSDESKQGLFTLVVTVMAFSGLAGALSNTYYIVEGRERLKALEGPTYSEYERGLRDGYDEGFHAASRELRGVDGADVSEEGEDRWI